METKLCRLCGTLGQNYRNIFKTDGLKHKIETCLPIIVSPFSLLPDLICPSCCDNVENFHGFIKQCLQNIIVLEAQYAIIDSCLKSKRRYEKGCMIDITEEKADKDTQTDDVQHLGLFLDEFQPLNGAKLVDYDIDSDANSEPDHPQAAAFRAAFHSPELNFGRRYFDDAENYLISEITQRKKRKCDEEVIASSQAKIFKMDYSSNRRKNRQPKKVQSRSVLDVAVEQVEEEDRNNHLDVDVDLLPQLCLLCDKQFLGPSMLASHVFEFHGIDMAHIVAIANEAHLDKKKKLPNLLKISDLRKTDCQNDNHLHNEHLSEEPPTLLPSFVCPVCPAVFTARPDLFTHLRVKHPEFSSFLCGLCLYQTSTLLNLQSHLEICSQHHQITTKYICQVCRYGDDNSKSLENHVLVHKFLLDTCKKQLRIFDPADYIETNESYESDESSSKLMSCSVCGLDEFDTFKEFSAHRRSQHSIFHCDLCNKFYGRNSHLWKHVNRLHKGHPSITCQICYKTSASKYHLAQHFNKIHSAKTCKPKSEPLLPFHDTSDFMSQKFQAFDFQSVKQSFMRQELLEQEKKLSVCEADEDNNSVGRLSDTTEEKTEVLPDAPKEIDSSSDLYTNIITNYTPPTNEGEFKCPKCSKGFHKKTLLKKHKKNCRPRLQKDLLTRCKSCARIFKDRQSLAKHLVNYHSEYACEICGQKVQSKCEIVSHIRFSHPGCHLVCTICGNILRSHSDLMDHTREHSESYICQFCADSLPSKIKLKMHILSLHRKILSLSCGVCLKLFESQHILRDHVRLVHKDQLAPLTSCPVCGKNYGSKWKTYDHLNKSHGRIFKACKTCLEVFDTELQLQTHYETVHGSTGVVVKQNVIPVPPVVPVSNNHCESDSEGNSSSEQSDPENADDEPHPKQEEYSFMDMNESRISLLEKRLLGKKAVEDEETKVVLAPQLPLVKNNYKKKPLEAVLFRKDDETGDGVYANPQHNSSKRTVYVNSNDPSYCEICLKTWPAKKHLWQHYIRCHKSVAATVCGICLRTNNSYATLQNHLRETHPTLLHGQGFGSNFICRICGRYHNARSKLRLHMAIHENFDWTLLDSPPKLDQKENSHEINYESLIEQVECSSDSDVVAEPARKVDSSSEDDDEDDEDSESATSSVHSQMLNILREKVSDDEPEKNVCYQSSESDESSVSGFSPKSEVSSEEVNGSDASLNENLLDEAIQSIKYEYVRKVEQDVDVEYCELQPQSLNDNEIDAAVGSIL